MCFWNGKVPHRFSCRQGWYSYSLSTLTQTSRDAGEMDWRRLQVAGILWLDQRGLGSSGHERALWLFRAGVVYYLPGREVFLNNWIGFLRYTGWASVLPTGDSWETGFYVSSVGLLSKSISSWQPHGLMWGCGYSLAVPRLGQGSLVSHLAACRAWCHNGRHSAAGCLPPFHPHPLPAGWEIHNLKPDAHTGGRLGSVFLLLKEQSWTIINLGSPSSLSEMQKPGTYSSPAESGPRG